MRRLAWIAVLLGSLLGACGGGTSTPLDASLSYLPKDSPFVVTVDTDVEGDQWKAVDSILKRFPIGGGVDDLLETELSGDGVDFRRDVKPLLGNPFVISATSVNSFLGDRGGDDFVAAIQVDDQDKLDALIDKLTPQQQGQSGGATVYRNAGTLFAVEDDIVVFAESTQLLEQALERADDDDHLDEESLEAGLDGLPQDALARVYADIEALVGADAGSRDGRKVEWIAALRKLGLTASAARDGIDVDFSLRTEAKDLGEEDLPISAGGESPPILDNRGEIGFGIRNPARIVRFAERAAQAIDPQGFGQYALAKKTLDARLDIDIDDDLIGALTGDVSGSIGVDGDFGLRAELEDPDAFERTLARAATALPDLVRGAGAGGVKLERPNRPGDLYVLRQADGDAYVFGVVDDLFVVAADPARAARLARESPVQVPDAEGAVVIGVDAARLATEILRPLDFGGLGAGLFAGALGDLAGFLSASADGLRGRFRLELE